MQELNDMLNQDARLWADAELTPEQYRAVIDGAVRPFREESKRDVYPVTVINDPGVLKSRHIKVVDLGSPHHGMAGTGGTYDRVAQDPEDEIAYAIWMNIEVPWREQQTAQRGGFNVLAESGMAAGELMQERENEMILKELGPVKGITKRSGVATFAGTNWSVAGNAYKDVVRAVVREFGAEKIPRGSAALLLNPKQEADLFLNFTNTDAAQLERIQRLLPGGVRSSTHVAEDEVFVYARTPSVLEYRVYQDFTVVPLPRMDEDDRMRTRIIGATHIKRPKGIVKITGVAG